MCVCMPPLTVDAIRRTLFVFTLCTFTGTRTLLRSAVRQCGKLRFLVILKYFLLLRTWPRIIDFSPFLVRNRINKWVGLLAQRLRFFCCKVSFPALVSYFWHFGFCFAGRLNEPKQSIFPPRPLSQSLLSSLAKIFHVRSADILLHARINPHPVFLSTYVYVCSQHSWTTRRLLRWKEIAVINAMVLTA